MSEVAEVVTGRSHLARYRVAAFFFDLLFFYPILRTGAFLAASVRGERFGADEFSLIALLFLVVAVLHHERSGKAQRFRSPGERIVGYTETGEIVSPVARRRWLLMIVVGSLLFTVETPRVTDFVENETLLTVKQQASADSPRPLASDAEEIANAFVGSAIILPLYLFAALRIARGSRGWLALPFVTYLSGFIINIGSPAMFFQGLFLTLTVAAFFYYREEKP